MGHGGDDPAAAFAREGGTITEIAWLSGEHLVLADDGRPLLLLPPGESPASRDGRIRAALARLDERRAALGRLRGVGRAVRRTGDGRHRRQLRAHARRLVALAGAAKADPARLGEDAD